MELVDFLRERLDEDEQAAKAATPGPWWYNPRKQWLDPEAFEKYDLAKGEEFVGYGGPHPFTGAVCATGPASHSQSMADAAHIARFADPARVLAEVEAKRELLKQHQPEEIPEHSRRSWQTFIVQCAGESWKVYGDAENRVEWPCRSVRLLALPYADHPDYREDWRP